ncbi:TRAP transporter small permease [Nocardiopsis chromatogenes]|uniref:TRAP transporter small permease n=1 Tax=Nocardiopsis chromatogenes TaxID=280239 RepID=UPI000347AAC8|nr:TRAP transporter small permease subunit [Nocardiopsis chromatogenes]
MTDPAHQARGGPVPRRRPAAVRWLEGAELAVGAALLTMIFALMLTQALQRHLPVAGWVWTGELARLGLVWLAFSLAGHLLGRDEHITLKVVDLLPGARLRRGVWILANLVVAAVGAAFTAEAAELVLNGPPVRTPALGLPMNAVYAVPLAGLALAALRAGANTLTAGPPAGPEPPADAGPPEAPGASGNGRAER